MFPLSPSMWVGVGVGGILLIVVLGLGVTVQTKRLDTAKTETIRVEVEFEAFKERVKILGNEQAAETRLKDAENAKLKTAVDMQAAKAKTDLAALYAKYRGLRNSTAANTGVSALPPAPSVTSSTPRTCFSSAGFAAAMGVLEAGIPNITEQGDAARLRLASSVEWAASLEKK